MNIFILPIAITLITVAIASYFDLKQGIIPNKLTFSLLIFGIAINSLFSILYNNSSYVFNSIILVIFTFIITYILWKIKLWAGGDVKLLTAIASCIPIQPNLLEFQFLNFQFPLTALYPFPLTMIFNSILISFPFLIIFSLLSSYKNYFKKNIPKYKKIMNFYNIINKIKENKKLIFKKIIISLIFSSFFIIATGLYANFYFSLYFLSFSIILSLITSFLFKSLIKNFRNFVKNSYSKEIVIFNLNEGMIIDNMSVVIDKTFNKTFNNLIEDFNSNEFNINIKKVNNEKSSEKKLNYILNSSTVAGLTLHDISFIKKLFNMELIHEKIPIKIGIPFAPSIAIGLIVAIFIGDLCSLLINISNNLFNYLNLI
jgi:preflagellin peptidase FlaK